MRVAVLQPHYLGYTGLFAMIDQVDKFVFYDDVQFEHQSWQQRNRIKTVNGVQWLTVPTYKRHGELIKDTEINYNREWRNKHLDTLTQSYSNSGFFTDSSAFWDDFYAVRFFKLADMNIYLTRTIAESIGCNIPKFYRSSDFVTDGHKTDKLISLLTQLDCTEYVSGLAAKDYIDEDKFRNAGIKLTWFNYKPVVYPQLHGEFVPYLSVLDCLFNCGGDTIKIIRSGNDR